MLPGDNVRAGPSLSELDSSWLSEDAFSADIVSWLVEDGRSDGAAELRCNAESAPLGFPADDEGREREMKDDSRFLIPRRSSSRVADDSDAARRREPVRCPPEPGRGVAEREDRSVDVEGSRPADGASVVFTTPCTTTSVPGGGN